MPHLHAWQKNGLAMLRIITGLLMAYHGWEIFYSSKIDEYLKWDVIKSLPASRFMIYVGKGIELISGILFVLGLFTRTAAVLMAADMLFICFIVGHGEFYYADQHPFVFAMLALIFFFMGPVKWSIDQLTAKQKRKYYSY